MRSLLPFFLFFVAGFIVLIVGRVLIMRVFENPEERKKCTKDSQSLSVNRKD